MNSFRITIGVFALLAFAGTTAIRAQMVSERSVFRLPAGTRIVVKMDNEINSRVSRVDDTFTATVSEPVKVRDAVVIPIGAVIEGRITKATRASTGRIDGSLTVLFEKLRLKSGKEIPISGVLAEELRARHSETASVLAIIGGTAIGGLLGAVSKGGSGALIGAGIGLGAGTGIALLRKGKEVRIRADETFEIETAKEVSLPAEDF